MNDAALAAENARLKARLAETEAALAEALEARRRLESLVAELRRERFGARSEKLDPEQFNLPLEDIEVAQGILEAAQEKAQRVLKAASSASETFRLPWLRADEARTTASSASSRLRARRILSRTT